MDDDTKLRSYYMIAKIKHKSGNIRIEIVHLYREPQLNICITIQQAVPMNSNETIELISHLIEFITSCIEYHDV